MLAAMFCSSSSECENIGLTHCCDRGMGWLNWVSLTCLLAVKGIATGLIASIFTIIVACSVIVSVFTLAQASSSSLYCVSKYLLS